MSLLNMANDIISVVKPDGKTIDNIKANVQPTKIFIFDEMLPLEEGDHIYRKLPSGLIESYLVIDRGFYSGHGMMEPHFQAKVKKEGSINQDRYNSITNIFNLSGENSKLNIGTIGNSYNYPDSDALFQKINERLMEIKNEETQNTAFKILQNMKQSQKTSAYVDFYKEFIALLADHIGIISAYIPALTQLINK